MGVKRGLTVTQADLLNAQAACKVRGKDISAGLTPEGTPVVYVGNKVSPAATELVELVGVRAAANHFARQGAGVRTDTLKTAFEE